MNRHPITGGRASCPLASNLLVRSPQMLLAAVGVSLAALGGVAAGQSFTVDPPSIGLPGTAVAGLAPAPEHIFNNVNPPGSVPPGVGFSGTNFVDLFDPDSPDRDALSAGYEPLDSEMLWDVMFSVDRDAQGLPGTGVHSRFTSGHAVGGDYYFANPHLGPGMNAVMSLTEVHHGLAGGPASQQEHYDNIDGAEIWDSRLGVEVPYSGFTFRGDALYDSVVGTPGGDAVIRENNVPFIHPHDLGLKEEDNVDALALDIGFEQEMNIGDGLVEVLFSLAPGSPSLFGPDGAPQTADDYSPADIFYTDLSGKFDIAGPTGLLGIFPGNLNFAFDLTARNLGLNFHPEEDVNDNVDAIDIIQTMTNYDFPMNPPENPGVPLIPPPPCGPAADFNCDQFVDRADLKIWQRTFGKDGLPAYDEADATGDGAVRGMDFIVWQRQFMPPASPTVAVPEPLSLGLFSIGLAALTLGRRRCV